MMKESSKWIAAFVEIIIENGDWTETDRYYLTNRIAKLVGCDFFEQPKRLLVSKNRCVWWNIF